MSSLILGQGFLNPALLPFLAAGLIPIIIYLLNRQRYQRVPWAAMEFLLRALRKNRKRIRLENLLLLIVRTLIVLLFVLGMARPFLESGTLPSLGGGSQVSEAFVIDRSYSMAAREGSRPRLRQALDQVRARLKNLKKGDRVGLFLAGGYPEVLLPDPRIVADTGSEELLPLLDDVEVVYDSLDLGATLQEVSRWIREEGMRGSAGAPWRVRLFTDLQRQDWLAEDGSSSAAIRDALSDLEEQNAQLVVHSLAGARLRNAGLVSLRAGDSLLSVDLPTTFLVSVENRCGQDLAGLEVELWVNGLVQASKTVAVDADETVDVSFPYVFRDAGLARIKAVVNTDALAEDNVRHLVQRVRESVEVVVADGGYDASAGLSEASWLRAALGSDLVEQVGVRYSPYQARVVPSENFAGVSLAEAEVLILANLGVLTPADSRRIEEFLEDGGGVLVYAGNRVDGASYGQHGYRGGEGWFPYAPGPTWEDPEFLNFFKWEIARADHPALSFLADNPDAGLKDVNLYGYLKPATPVEEGSVLMRVSDGVGTPALVERRYGDGTVLVLNTGPDRSWSNFPTTPAYVVFLYETLPYLVARQDVRRTLVVQEPFARVVPAEEFASEVVLFLPDGGGVPFSLEARGDSRSFLLKIPGQESPGIYEIRFGSGAEEEVRSEWLAVNADPREGVLTDITDTELLDYYPQLNFASAAKKEARDEDVRRQGGELWRTIFWSVLALLVAESCLAFFFGRARGRRGGE